MEKQLICLVPLLHQAERSESRRFQLRDRLGGSDVGNVGLAGRDVMHVHFYVGIFAHIASQLVLVNKQPSTSEELMLRTGNIRPPAGPDEYPPFSSLVS